MAKNKITDYSATNASNTDLGGIDIQGTGYISNGDNAIRELMTHLADVSKGTYPVADTWSFADPADLTKIARFDCGSITTSTTRVITIPNRSGALMTGPSSTSDNTVPRFNGTSGDIQTSGVTITDGNQVAASGGSAAAPAFTFSGSEDEGMYQRTSTSIGFSINGSEVWYFSASAIMLGTDMAIQFNGTGAATTRTNLGTTIAADTNLGTFSATGVSNGRDFSDSSGRNSRSSASTTSGAREHHAFYNPNGLVGSITTTGSATAFNTTSDETLKDFIGKYDPVEAMKIIRADPARDFRWKKTGEYAVGWGAQTSYGVSKDLASPGGWFNAETEEPCSEDDKNGVYRPWGVDQSRRTPYLWAVIPYLEDRIAALEAEVAALKAA